MSVQSCIIKYENLGVSLCNNLPSIIKGMITTPSTYKLSPANSLLQAQWQLGLLAASDKRTYRWPDFVDFKDVSDKAVYDVTPLTDMPVLDGKYKFELAIKKDLCLHKKMYTHRANTGRVFLVDFENNIIGTQDNSGNFLGFTMSLLHTEKLMFSDGKVASKSPLHLVLADNKELDLYGAMVQASSFYNLLVPLTDVTITLISATTTKIVVTVSNTCDGTPVSGLVTADFVVLTAAGVVQVVTAVEAPDGTYTLTGTAMVTGTVNLVSAALLSVPGFEAAATTLTIPFP